MELFFVIVLGLMLALGVITFFVSIFKMRDGAIGAEAMFFCSITGIILFATLFILQTVEYQKPNHGRIPQLSDVPEKAHLIEHKIITGNDTTYKYTIEWNDVENQ